MSIKFRIGVVKFTLEHIGVICVILVTTVLCLMSPMNRREEQFRVVSSQTIQLGEMQKTWYRTFTLEDTHGYQRLVERVVPLVQCKSYDTTGKFVKIWVNNNGEVTSASELLKFCKQ